MKGVVVPIVGTYEGSAFRRAEQDIQRLGTQARRQSTGVAKFGSAFKGAFAGGLVGGGVGAAASAVAGLVTDVAQLALTFAKDGVTSAMEEEKALAALGRQAAATGSAFDGKAISSFVDNLQFATNVTDGELYPALTKLTAATGSLSQAQGILASAVDASVGSGKTLDSVTTALSKAAAGQTSSLKRLFPALDANVLATGDLVAIQGELNRVYGGAAATALDTTSGQMANLKIAIDEAAEALGTGLLAGFTGTTGGAKDLVTMLRDSQPQLESFGQAIGTLGIGLSALAAEFNTMVLGWRIFLGALTKNDDAIASAWADFDTLKSSILKTGEAWSQTSADVTSNPIIGIVGVTDPYGAALGASVEPFKKAIEEFIAGITAAREETQREADAADEAAKAARQALNRQIDARASAIAQNARAQLQAAKDEIASFRSITEDFKRGITEFGAVSSLQADAGVNITAGMITDNMRQRLAVIKDFAGKVKTLQNKGLPASVLVDIINQGPFEGLRYADAILASKTAISDIQSLTSSINAQAGIIGNVGAEATTGTTLGALQGGTTFQIQAGGINITVNGEVNKTTVQNIRDAVADAMKRAAREAKASRKSGARG